MRGRRGLFAVIVTCALAGLLVLFAAGRVWGRTTARSVTGVEVAVTVRGHDVVPSLTAWGITLVVLALGMLAARSWLRLLAGLLVVLVGGVVLALSVGAHGDLVAALAKRSFAVAHSGAAPGVSIWAVVAAVGGAAAVVAGAVAVLFGRGWPGLGSRYEAPRTTQAEPARSTWEALDRGEDPTL